MTFSIVKLGGDETGRGISISIPFASEADKESATIEIEVCKDEGVWESSMIIRRRWKSGLKGFLDFPNGEVAMEIDGATHEEFLKNPQSWAQDHLSAHLRIAGFSDHQIIMIAAAHNNDSQSKEPTMRKFN